MKATLKRPRGRNSEELLSEINVTPFVDVLLVLLVVFMITAPLLTHSLGIELPQGQSPPQENAPPPNPLVVVVDPQQSIVIEKQTFQLDQVARYLEQLPADFKKRAVHLQMDQSLTHGFLIKLMLTFKNAGFQHVGLIFREEQKPASTGR